VNFTGTYTPKLDDKGRLTLPAKYREELAGGLTITKGQDRSLAVYPKAEFERIAEKANMAEWTDPAARAFQRNFFASSDEQRPDAQGRITLSVDHRRYAGLTKECVVVGSWKFLEIWDAEAWEAYQQAHEDEYAQPQSDALRSIF
jgi:MraZ protein